MHTRDGSGAHKNLYAYAGGNPVYFIDALGLAAESPGASGARLGASIGVGFIPFVGTGQSVVELVTGQDYIAGTDASRAFAAVGVVAGLFPAGKAVVKGLSNADDVARLARSPAVIGENMVRVEAYAGKIGAETFQGTGMAANRAWIQEAQAAGKQVIDIGPDFARRAQRASEGVRPDSIFYNMERMETGGYGGYQRIFERTGRYDGGIPGFDY